MATELRMQIENRNGRSVLGECFFSSPLKIGTPNNGTKRFQAVLMMASAGMLKGDSFDYRIHCGKDSNSIITEQSYSKIFDTGDGAVTRNIQIELEPHASFYYRPCAVIPFAGSTFDGNMQVDLTEESEFAYTDIVTAGRIGMGERFLFKHYRSKITVCVEGKKVWFDHCLLEPEKQNLEQMIFFDGYTHQGTFYYYGTKEKEELLYQKIADEEKAVSFLNRWKNTEADVDNGQQSSVICGVTHAKRGICVRLLANTSQDIEEKVAQFAGLLHLED